MGYIGEKKDLRKIELEPMPDDIPAPEPAPVTPEREEVPA
jgi:hypothetical protein